MPECLAWRIRVSRSTGARWAGRRFQAIAMSVYASGAIEPWAAVGWVRAQPNVESSAFRASSRCKIASTKSIIDELCLMDAKRSNAGAVLTHNPDDSCKQGSPTRRIGDDGTEVKVTHIGGKLS